MAKNKNALQDALDWLGGAASNAGKAVVDTAQGFGNAFSNNNLMGSYKPSQPQNIARTFGEGVGTTANTLWDAFIFNPKNLQKMASNPLTKSAVNAIPKLKLSDSVQNPILKFGAQVGEGIVNSPANTFQGSQKLLSNIGNKDYTWQQGLGDAAQAIDLPLTLATFGQLGSAKAATKTLLANKGSQGILKTAAGIAKIGAKEGGETGLLYGLKGGLEGNRETKDVADYLKNVGTSTAIGGTLGAVLGGTLSGATYATGAGLNKVLADRRSSVLFKNYVKKDSGAGWSPFSIRESLKKSNLENTEFGKMLLNAAGEAEKSGKYVKFTEELIQPDGKVRIKSRTPTRSINLVDAPAPAGAPVNMRPDHQIALEQAAANNDSATIKYILDNMSPDDPYKAPMERLFRPMAEGAEMKTVSSPIGKNPDIAAKVNPNPVPEGVDKVVFRAVDSTDGRSVLGEGTYFGEAPSAVERYGKDIKRFIIDKNAKMIDLRMGDSLSEFTDDAIRVNRDEFNDLLEKKGGDAALGWVMKKHATDLGYDGIRADEAAYGTVVFNKDMIRPDTSVPEGTDTIAGVQKMINELSNDSSPNKAMLENPDALMQQLKDDPQAVLRAAEPVFASKAPTPPPKPNASFSETPGLDQIAAAKPPRSFRATIAETRSKTERAYDAFVDEFDPLFRSLKKNGGDEEGMRRELAGWYGAGSKAEGRLEQDYYPIIARAEKEVGLDNFREALIDLGTIERGTRGTFGYAEKVDNSKYGLDVLANKLGPEKMAKLQTLLDDWYEYHRQGTQMAVDAGVISPQHQQNMLDRNQFYVHFDRIMDDVDDYLITTNTAKFGSPGSMSKQDVFLTVKGGTQKIKDPIASAIYDTHKLQAAIERNKVATAATDKLSAVGLANQITSAENKLKRQSIFSDLAELKPLKNKVDRTLKSLMRVGKKLEQEKAIIAREAVEKVKGTVGEENRNISKNLKLQDTLDNITGKASKASQAVADSSSGINNKVDSVVDSLDNLNTKIDTENLDTLAQREGMPDLSGPLTGKKAKALMEQLIDMDEYTLNRFKQRLGAVDDKTQKVLTDIDNYRNILDQINQKRSSLYDEARLARDASTRGKNVIYRLNGGIKEAWEVDPLVAESLKGLNSKQLSMIATALNLPTKVFRATATGINPDFMLPNIVRDMQSAFVNFGVNPIDYAKGVAHFIKKDEVYDQWLRAGGKLSRLSLDEDTVAKNIAKVKTGDLLPARSKSVTIALGKNAYKATKEGLGLIFHPKDILKATYHTLQDIGSLSEQPTRLAAFEKVYNQSLKNGMTKAEALQAGAYASQEASANFARGGFYTPEFNSLFAFTNARIQGLDRIARTIKKDPKGALTRIGMITIAPALSAYAWNRMFPAYYDENVLPQYVKDKNFVIMLSNTPLENLGGAQYLLFPKGDVGRLANPLESMMAFADGHKGEDGTNPFAGALASLLEGFSPVDINTRLNLRENIGNMVTPTALKPLVEGWANKNFFTGDEIIPDNVKDLPAKDQVNYNTAPTYRWLGERLNVSPALLQNYVEGYGTGIAKLTTGVLDKGFEGMGVEAPDTRGADINRMPIARRFLGGEKKTAEEAASSLESQAGYMDYQVNQIKSAIKKGRTSEEDGYALIEQIKTKQQELYDRADAMRVSAGEIDSIQTTPTGKKTDASGLVPSAYAEANPSDIAALLKADEKKKFTLERWSLNPTEANAKNLKLDYDEATMWLLAKLPDDVESQYISKDIYAQKDVEKQDAQAMKYIEAGRLTNEKVNKSLEMGTIDGDQADHLKDLIKKYKISKGLLKGPKAKKIKVASMKTGGAAKIPTIKFPKIKGLGKLKLNSVKSGSLRSGTTIKAPKLSVSEYRPAKIKMVGRVALR
jgi:Large polyvalent protein associated domain 38